MLYAERILASSLLAFSITFGLFWLMQGLIVQDEISTLPDSDVSIVPFIHLRVAPTPVRTVRRKPRIERPEQAPPLPELPTTDGGDSGRRAFFIERKDHSSTRGAERNHWRPVPADGDAVPMIRIEPKYPERALRRGIEGRVLVEFSIARSGAVENARVIASEPGSIFDAAALKAVRQWRYSPRIENGVAVEQHGIQIAIPFRPRDEDR